jgi:hypothetical protein
MAESEKERVDRELIELLNEIRVALPGVQVLFAFLLILPFQQGFDRTTELQRTIYLVALLCTAGASALLIAPSSYHRIRFRQQDKKRMLFTSNKLVLGGIALMAVGIGGSVFLITDYLFGHPLATGITVAAALWYAWFWYGLPLSRRVSDSDSGGDEADEA